MGGLRALVAVSAHTSMTRAAEELGVTVSAVSHQLTALESVLGVQLIERDSRPVKLTPTAQHYAARLRPAFEQIQGITRELFSQQRPHQLTVTTYPLFGVKWLLPRLASFHSAHAGIELTLTSTNRVVDLRSGEADIAIRLGKQKWDGCEVIHLMSDRAVIACAPRLLNGKQRRGNLLKTIPLIVYERNGRLWKRWAKANQMEDLKSSSARLFDEPLAAVEAAVAGGGMVLTLRALIERELESGTLVEALPSVDTQDLDHCLVVRQDARERPAVQCFIDWAQREAGKSVVSR